MRKIGLLIFVITCLCGKLAAQQVPTIQSRPISPDLFGIFFEDLSYAADGGLYAELIQNRSFEYTPADNKNWNPLTAWQYVTDGFGYGRISVESANPINANNPHYLSLIIDDEGQKGLGIRNNGYDGIVLKAGEQYNFSVFMRQVSANAIPVEIQLQNSKGAIIGTTKLSTETKDWKKYSATITTSANSDTSRLVILAKGKGHLDIDMVSLFPQKTFKNHPNGLRADIAQTVADLHPKFMRFPGGCLVHGDGIANIYRWKNTIGPVEQRVEQRDIWTYHQSVGLGFFEYFQFCEDIGAKPVPVVAAGVSCQNSGGTWAIGGTGQRGIPMVEMGAYIQDILDLIEYANGPSTSTWGAKRAAAGHPAPFHLEYLGVGNEDKMTDEFRTRFEMIYSAVKAKHPEITLIGTVGPFHSGEDYDLGWKLANQLKIAVVDEHYYEKAEWFLVNNKRYDNYNRLNSKVYVGEYASQGNTLYNALAEACYMTSLERNGDVVKMASYAPLLARLGHTSWNPNLIYFNGVNVYPTVNYYVQQLFSVNSGDVYYSNVILFVNAAVKDSLVAASCVKDSHTGDIILKIVNAGAEARSAKLNLKKFALAANAEVTILAGERTAKDDSNHPDAITPKASTIALRNMENYNAPAYSLTVIRIKPKK